MSPPRRFHKRKVPPQHDTETRDVDSRAAAAIRRMTALTVERDGIDGLSRILNFGVFPQTEFVIIGVAE